MLEKRTVLFVDDDKIMLQSIERYLLDEPYHKLFAKGSKEALDIMQQEKVHVIVSDIRMPVIDGNELLKIVRKKYPHVVKIVLSGYGGEADLQTAVDQEGIFNLIPKPWNRKENLKIIILEAIDRFNLQNQREMGQFITKGDSDV